jgi:hypothetical protein
MRRSKFIGLDRHLLDCLNLAKVDPHSEHLDLTQRLSFPSDSLSLLLVSVIFQVLIIVGKPLEESLENKMSMFNKVTISGYLYLALLLTDYVDY